METSSSSASGRLDEIGITKVGGATISQWAPLYNSAGCCKYVYERCVPTGEVSVDLKYRKVEKASWKRHSRLSCSILSSPAVGFLVEHDDPQRE
uniref:Uncharacterized protein n=1 Tax=Ascaris lumbricoides TaxID=6252 RepID=A0A0M3HNQ6_ASCLU